MKKPNRHEPKGGSGGHDAAGDPEALDRQRVLGVRLRSLFDGVVDEPVPDDFTRLLDKLDDESEPR